MSNFQGKKAGIRIPEVTKKYNLSSLDFYRQTEPFCSDIGKCEKFRSQ
jgi:hypothetical protein